MEQQQNIRQVMRVERCCRIKELEEINEKLKERIAELEDMMEYMVPLSCMLCDRTWGVNEDGYCEKCADE